MQTLRASRAEIIAVLGGRSRSQDLLGMPSAAASLSSAVSGSSSGRSRRSSEVEDGVVSAAAAAASAPLLHSGFLFKRGSYTWNSKEVKLYQDGTLTIATSSNQQRIKHVLAVKGGFAVVELHTKAGTRGWRYC